jgi:hypothetical protein
VKKIFVGFLVLNLLLEGLTAVFLIGGPQGIRSDAQSHDGILWAANYGFGAIAIASAIFWVWPNRDSHQTVGAVLGILLTFHTLIFVSFAIQGDQIPPMLIHAVMAAIAIFLYLQRSKYTT